MITENDIKEVASGPVEVCNICDGEGGWEAAASSTSYFWKRCDCALLKTNANNLIELRDINK